MPPRSTVSTLPKEVKEWLDKALLDKNFSEYEALEEALKEKGFSISKSSIHRYGKDFKERLDGIRKSTEMAKVLAAEAGDDEGALNDALVRILQDKLFTLVMDLKVDPAKINVSSLSRSIADLARASVTQKKFMAEVKNKAKVAVEDIEKKAETLQLQPGTLKYIKEVLYGLAS